MNLDAALAGFVFQALCLSFLYSVQQFPVCLTFSFPCPAACRAVSCKQSRGNRREVPAEERLARGCMDQTKPLIKPHGSETSCAAKQAELPLKKGSLWVKATSTHLQASLDGHLKATWQGVCMLRSWRAAPFSLFPEGPRQQPNW